MEPNQNLSSDTSKTPVNLPGAPIQDIQPAGPPPVRAQPNPIFAPPVEPQAPAVAPEPETIEIPEEPPTPPEKDPTTEPTPPTPKKDKKRRWPMMLFLLILVVALIAGGLGYWHYKHANPTNSQRTAGVPDVETPTSTNLNLSPQLEATKTTHQQTLNAKLNKQVNMSDGFSFMATQTQVYTSATSLNQPAAGNEFLQVTITAGNRATTGILDFTEDYFQAKDSTGKMTGSNFATDQLPQNNFATTVKLAPGQQKSGSIVFEVPADKSTVSLVYKKQYKNDTTGTVITLIGNVKLR